MRQGQLLLQFANCAVLNVNDTEFDFDYPLLIIALMYLYS